MLLQGNKSIPYICHFFYTGKIYTEKRQFFAKNLSKMPIFRVKSVEIYTSQKKFTRVYLWDP